MNYGFEIPAGHWTHPEGDRVVGAYKAHWEMSLRKAVEAQPDPAKRFGDWLSRKAADESGLPGVRLIFFEQPYLTWAENVERAIEGAERSLRARIASEIANPED